MDVLKLGLDGIERVVNKYGLPQAVSEVIHSLAFLFLANLSLSRSRFKRST